MVQPSRYVDSRFPNHVCKLQKSLYGLKQAPLAWFERFSTQLLHMGFESSQVNSSLFILRYNKILVYLLVYVDDIVLTGNSQDFLQSFINQLSQIFELKDFGDLHFFLGLHIHRSPKGIFLNQAKYITDLLTKHHMLNSKPAKTPCVPHVRLVPDAGTLLSDPHVYRSLVGSLQYLTFTRPDLSFAIHQVCQFMSFPMDVHLVATKRILRYLVGTQHFGIRLQLGPLSFYAFSDSDWASDPYDCRSTTRFLVYLGYNPITWSAKKQFTVSRSSIESEYCALASTVAELCWLR